MRAAPPWQFVGSATRDPAARMPPVDRQSRPDHRVGHQGFQRVVGSLQVVAGALRGGDIRAEVHPGPRGWNDPRTARDEAVDAEMTELMAARGDEVDVADWL